jgi:hypothetical protein
VADGALPEVGLGSDLDDVPDAGLSRLAEQGFEWVWFLSVWETGSSRAASFACQRRVRKEFQGTLPDLREEDITGAGFANHRSDRTSATGRMYGETRNDGRMTVENQPGFS